VRSLGLARWLCSSFVLLISVTDGLAQSVNFGAATNFAVVTATFSATFVFTDDPLSPTLTPVKAVHVTELREVINALRLNNDTYGTAFTTRLRVKPA
jgi:hypothetical protein